MVKKASGMDLLKRNFNRVEEKFLDYFEKGQPSWPMEKRDYLRNHHQSLDQFFAANVSLDKLKLNNLPENIVQEVHAAFDAFKNGEEYN
jgi:hypothetical protein